MLLKIVILKVESDEEGLNPVCAQVDTLEPLQGDQNQSILLIEKCLACSKIYRSWRL